MGKDKKKNKKDKKEETIALNKTAKFAVLDAPGVTQPKLEDNETDPATASKPASSNARGQQGRRATSGSGPRIEDSNKIGGESFPHKIKNPDWLKERSSIYEEVKALRLEELSKKIQVPIKVTLPDGKVIEKNKAGDEDLLAWKSTPYDVAVVISQGLADNVIVSKVTYSDFVDDYDLEEDGMAGVDLMELEEDDEPESEIKEEKKSSQQSNQPATILWDMKRPLVGNVSKIEFLKFADDTDAKTVFWHSSAHMLGEALEHSFGCRLTIGPPLSGGFYYDSYMGTNDALTEDDYKTVETEVQKITKQKQAFERMVVTKKEALSLFAGNPFKEQIISSKIPDGSRTTVYKCGDLIDLCRGPHVTHTGKVKAFAATRHSATCWLGDTDNDSLQRMYGISFPDKKMLKVWKENQEKAKERDHRRISAKQNLIWFHELSPGSAFWLPHGTRIYNALINFIKAQYWKRGYDEIVTPNMYNLELWNRSGHALHYKDAMFCFDVEGQEFALKPMNCPGHCLMFASTNRSYRELPIRLADFGVLHRNELSGTLTGLTRVRRFQQDDAHIFCREDQVETEVLNTLHFMKEVYDTFGMTYKLELSTRPKKALGEVDIWKRAEGALAGAMNTFAGKGNWKVNPGDGAFYGPKIDIKVMDAMDRIHQCATVQLDFQLPIRFDLQYTTNSNVKGEEYARPVMVHRAILGSVERMFAVLCEHYGGKWPLWLSPRQVMLIPVHAEFNDYCDTVRKTLHDAGLYCDVDLSKATFTKKVRNAQIAQYNYQLVVGKEEVSKGSVNIRTRENVVEGEMPVGDFVNKLKEMRDTYK